jgi:hypothetical protein
MIQTILIQFVSFRYGINMGLDIAISMLSFSEMIRLCYIRCVKANQRWINEGQQDCWFDPALESSFLIIIVISRLVFLIPQGFIVTFKREYDGRLILFLAQQIFIILTTMLLIFWSNLKYSRYLEFAAKSLGNRSLISMKPKRLFHQNRHSHHM